MRTALLLLSFTAATGCATSTTIEAVTELEVERYLGTWYDVGSFPQSFQEGCACTTATYEERDDGDISVTNRCRKEGLDGPEDEARARAYLPDPSRPGELKVEFFWPFAADYWVIELGDPGDGPYSYAVVSEPGMEYLWILSRTPSMEPALFDEIVARLEGQGFEMSRLAQTRQEGCWSE